MSLTVLLRPCLAGEGAVNLALSQESCRRPHRGGPGAAATLVPALVPGTFFILKQSPYLLFSQCPLYFLVSYLHKRWAAFGCSLCFSVEWVGVSTRCRGKLTPLPPISPPSSLPWKQFYNELPSIIPDSKGHIQSFTLKR